VPPDPISSPASHASPDGAWRLEITKPQMTGLYAVFISTAGYFGFRFGRDASPQDIEVRWDLPDKVCGGFIDGDCYFLFRYGPKRRRNREWSRWYAQPPFTAWEIAAVCGRGSLPHRAPMLS